MDMRKTRIFLIIAIMLILMTGTAGCARLQSGIHDLHGSIIGNEYNIDIFDNTGVRTLRSHGKKIDIDNNGGVSICGTDQAMMDKAVKYIKIITTDFEEGQILTGKVVSIKDFGAFLEFAPGKEGMVHISKIAKERIDKVEDVLSLGDVVKVVCLGKDRQGRISFSIKDVPKEN